MLQFSFLNLKSSSRLSARSAILGFTLAWVATFTATELVKRSIGAPRPNFYSLSALLAYDERAGTDAYGKFRDERYMNIPSGHSSMSMVSFLYLTLFMTTKVHVFHAAVSPWLPPVAPYLGTPFLFLGHGGSGGNRDFDLYVSLSCQHSCGTASTRVGYPPFGYLG